VSLVADHLFTKCIPHLDVDGRMTGDPELVKLVAVPLRDEITAGMVPELLAELVAVGLVVWYEVGEKQILEFPGFPRQQPGLRKDREAASKLPSSGSKGAVLVTGPDPAQLSLAVEGMPSARRPRRVTLRSRSGALRESSGVARVKVSEVKISEVKSSSGTNVPEAGPRVDNDRAVHTPTDLTTSALMGVVRQHLYVPDGKAPTGEDGGRCVTVIQALRKARYSGYEIADAIEGLALLRERGELDWLPPGTKCTMRALYNTRTGVRPVFMLAQETAVKHASRRRQDEKVGSGMRPIGEILRGIA
jgi:hypothetical protein